MSFIMTSREVIFERKHTLAALHYTEFVCYKESIL